MTALNQREQYQSDQGLWAPGLPVLVAGPLLAAIGVAWGLKFLYFHDWYLLVLGPVVLGLLLGGVLALLVGWTQCRNSWLAGGIGVLAGLIAYLGYYHLCLLHELPLKDAARVDLLPRYIVMRMRTDVAEEVGRVQIDNRRKKPTVGLNWYTFIFELAIMAGAPAIIARKRARRAYCPDLSQWMQQEAALLPPHSGEALQNAFEADQLEEFVARSPAGGDAMTACKLTLEHAQPGDDSPLSYPIYATIEDLPTKKAWYWPKQARRTYVRQAALTTAEVLTLRPLFPKLARLLETHHEALRDLPANVLPAPTDLARAEDVAEITPVPEPYRQRVRTRGYALKVNLIGLTPAVFIFGGIGLLVLGGYLISKDDVALGLGPCILGGLSCAWGLYTGLYCLSVYENRWIERRLRAEIGQRPDFLVDPSAADAAYVSLIPREHWLKVKLTMASDLLLMRIDAPRREVLLEGDCDRYRIPSGAIAVCEPQCFFHPIDTKHQNEFWMVRLMIQVEKGTRELLLSVGHTDWRPRTNSKRQKIAQETCQKINALQITSLGV